ncbi:unnamed protein product [Eruca vesicaria subsp. sativa]|uniref:Uncharacterized protein n=1 Tax=Eruca vesicaria subsp. sativa TaxID=29727 RepID=A0ABC8IYV7_ERUVS|nr:unnamed protein product [Eruca vesicaria subsp. sativa]
MMKTAGAITLIFPMMMISLLLIAITASGAVDSDVVLDSNGDPVRAFAPYYIEVRTSQGRRANISEFGIDENHALSCPQRVVAYSDELMGIAKPVIFLFSTHFVRVSAELSIKFAWTTECDEPGVWKVADSIDGSSWATKEIFLSGTDSSSDSTFIIKKSENGSYKLAFGSSEKPQDFGLDEIRYGVWRLILSNNSGFTVSFVPA